MENTISGTYVAIVTPMQRDGNRLKHAINYDAAMKLLDFLARNNVDGFVICGCTGADALLEHKEQIKFIRRCNLMVPELEKAYGQPFLVIAGDGSNFTYEAVELAKRVEGETGVMHHLQISPYKVKPTQQGIIEHYSEVAKGIEGKIIMYSVNGRTGGLGILPATALELAQHPQIIAIKEASAGARGNNEKENVARAREVMESVKAGNLDFTVLSGDDDATVEMIKYGATGVISVAANVDPYKVSEMVKAALKGDNVTAKEYHDELTPLFKGLFTENNPQDVMYALYCRGLDVGVPRLPLREPTQEAKSNIKRVIELMGRP